MLYREALFGLLCRAEGVKWAKCLRKEAGLLQDKIPA